MNLKTISLVLGLSITGNLAAAERMCFGQVPVETSTDLVAKITIAENNFFANDKCKRFFSYYEKHVNFSQAECEVNKDQLSLDKGYAPFPVFLRGTDSTGKDNIASYDWEIKNIATNEVLSTYNAFNAAYVFDKPGEYSATLTITGKDGSTSTDTSNITVWPRDGKNYFVDSVIGDDRYNGLAQTPDTNCDANIASLNTCSGPWKTATRALGEFSPYNATNYPNGKYTAEAICLQKDNADIVRYNQGNFKVFRSSTFFESSAKKDSEGNFLPAISTEFCSQLSAKRKSILRPGDQILFNRSQTFDLETGIKTLRAYIATNSGIRYNYEKLETKAITTIGHWSKAIGVHVGAYGEGQKPIIKNTGNSSTVAILAEGKGMFNLSFSELIFDLETNTPTPYNNRSTFLTLTGHPINTSLKNIEITKMHQGIIGNSKTGAGLFVFNSKFYDSKIIQLFTQESYNDVAVVNSSFDYSANHLIYTSIASGLIYNNKLSRPAFGRDAFRLSGGAFNNPNNYVWISENEMTGWIDPRTNAEFGKAFSNGLRYNYRLVELAPNRKEDFAIHDVMFTRNKVTDAETLLEIGDGENITITNNTFQTQDSERNSRVFLNKSFSRRPLKNINITKNIFIDSSPTIIENSSRNFISLANYYQQKCSDQFNHEKISITDNTFYTPYNKTNIFAFTPLKQGNDINGTALANLTLDQAESFIRSNVTLNNNKIYTENNALPTIKIGGDFRPPNIDLTTVNWDQYYSGTSPTGGDFRLYNSSSLLTSALGSSTWASLSETSIEALLTSGATEITLAPKLTWDDIIAYAQENNISPADLEVLILNQVLASNPSYSGPGSDYSAEMSPLDQIGNWFASIPSQVAGLFDSEENKYSDAKSLATTNNVSASKVLQDMKI